MLKFLRSIAYPFVWFWVHFIGFFRHRHEPYTQTINRGLRNLPRPIAVGGEEDSVSEAAIKWWNDQVGFPLFVWTGACSNHGFAASIQVQYLDTSAFPSTGYTTWGDKTADIIIKLSGRGIRSLLCHELGHALGFEHSRDPSSIMYPTTFDQQVVSKLMLGILRSGQ